MNNGERHAHYDRTVSIAALYRKLVTGDGLNDLLRQFVQRETDAAFNQRVALTQHVVTTVTKNIMDVFNKVPRSNYQRILEYTGTPGDIRSGAMEQVLNGFWGESGVDEYVQTRWLELNATDPNAFIVVEFSDFDNNFERASPYPFEVFSKNAVDYRYENNVLQHLIVRAEFPLPTKSKPKGVGEKFTVYLENETFVLFQIDKDTVSTPIMKDGEWLLSDVGGLLLSNDRLYSLAFTGPHDAGRVPARRVGYSRDPWTNGQTFVSPYDAAVPLLIKSIKVNSELDITMSQQVFPHRAQYMPKCVATDCLNGRTANGGECSTCKGTGRASITSAQEIIYINLPKPGEPLWDLEKLLVFKGPPIDIVQFQSDYVDKLTAGCKAVVFNSESFTREQISSTATGKNLDRDNVQDTLYSCAIGFAGVWAFLVELSSIFTQLDKDLTAKLVFSKDFKLKGLSELVADLESAKRSEAGPAVVQHIQDNIARLMYSEDPSQYVKWSIKERFNPFSGYNSEMVSLALTDTAVPTKYKVRYLMLGVLFAEIEAETPNFYLLDRKEQTRIVDEKVAQYIDSSESSGPALNIPGINPTPAA